MGRGSGTEQIFQGRPTPYRGRRRPPSVWTDERIEAELRRLAREDGGRLPTTAKLQRLGLTGLKKAIARRGIAYWAERLGLSLAPGQDRSPYGIEEARADIGRVLVAHGRLPGTNKLRELGYPRLAGFIVKHGGVARFCAAYRVPSRRAP